MFTISIDPGYRNLGIVIFADGSPFKILFSKTFSIGGSDEWKNWYKHIINICEKDIWPIIKTDEEFVNIICEKQKEHPFHEISGFIVGYLVKLFTNINEIKYVDPRAVWKSTRIKSIDRADKKKLTKEAINLWNDTNDLLCEHEADCILNYFYYKGLFKSAKWHYYILLRLKDSQVQTGLS